MMVNLVTQAGPMVALVLFFVWSDNKRDERNRIERDELHQYVRDTLVDLVKESHRLLNDFEHKDEQ